MIGQKKYNGVQRIGMRQENPDYIGRKMDGGSGKKSSVTPKIDYSEGLQNDNDYASTHEPIRGVNYKPQVRSQNIERQRKYKEPHNYDDNFN